MNKGTIVVWIMSGLILAGGAAVGKEKEKMPTSPSEKSMGGMGNMGAGMSMMDMMGKSHMGCMATSDTLDKLLKTVQDAERSEDKAKMKAALVLTENHISEMKGHMGQCMNMMDSMGRMMDGSGIMAMNKGQEPSPPTGKSEKAEPTDHEKHHPKNGASAY